LRSNNLIVCHFFRSFSPLKQDVRATRGRRQIIVVAADFWESSHHALLAGVRLFPGHDLILYHAHQHPFAGIFDGPSHANINSSTGKRIVPKFWLQANFPPTWWCAVIEHGVLGTALTRYVRSHEINLVKMGTHGRSGITSILLGSSAAKLLDWLPCDTMVIREPRAAIA
jgi:universal stress protein family protein